MEGSRLLAALAGGLVLAASAAPLAAARHGRLNATYTGQASGSVSGTSASGSASTSGRGSLVGKSTFSGSATGDASTPPCIHFTGRGSIKSAGGTIRLASLPGATACVAAASGDSGTFTGKARISGGTGKFAHARGTLAFSGSFEGHAVRITLTGSVRY
jgi:hypothetical protein